MGWFNAKAGERKGKEVAAPELPELPKLPELPSLGEEEQEPLKQPPISRKDLNPLPSFSTKSLEKKFSKNAIKNAVSGGKEDDVRHANELGSSPMMHLPHRKKLTKELEGELDEPTQHIPEGFHEAAQKVKEAEPVFIRIDKFQDSLNLFEKIKREVHEIEQKLNSIRNVKDEEEKELNQWQKEVVSIKEQINQIDKDVFSKVD